MMQEIKTTQDLVLDILQEQPTARNSDDMLRYFVYEKIAEKRGLDLNCISAKKLLTSRKAMGFPSSETIRRTRQKLQAAFPELTADEQVEGYRTMNEMKFREYAKRFVI